MRGPRKNTYSVKNHSQVGQETLRKRVSPEGRIELSEFASQYTQIKITDGEDY